jgi:D-beta-D-heptose 7-phosphate kinase/D-beta-D-heptose 1-phosphate adenosyltransferase
MNILVIGEIILDTYLYCNSNRLATEGMFPIYKIKSTENKLGGAANVALNISNLNLNTTFISTISNDENTEKIINLLNNNNIKHKLILDINKKNTIKTRILKNNSFYSRFDYECLEDINTEQENEIINVIKELNNTLKIDGIVLSDYNKGLLTNRLINEIILYSNNNNIITFVDPKGQNYQKYINCTFFKPNKVDASFITNKINIDDILKDVYDKINCKYLIYTLAKDGIIYYDGINKMIINNIKNIDCIDPNGAGDIVISLLTFYYLKTNNIIDTLELCNFVASKSVKYIGNYICSNNDIIDYLNSKNNDNLRNKTLKFEDIHLLKKNNKKIVFTNGCFDIVHTAHLKLLKFSKSKGDILIVGLNSDKSIKNLKGSNRPINNNNDRFEFLALLDFVDYIILFDEDTPYNILSELKPNILIKGGDYKIEQLLGHEFCEEVIFFNYIENKSSSIIINKIKDNKEI